MVTSMNKKAYVLVEMLVALIAYGAILIIMLSLLKSLLLSKPVIRTHEFEIALKQLRWQISLSHHLYQVDEHYCFDYELDQRCLNIKNKRLYLSPGTIIVLSGYEDLTLFEHDNWLWIKGTKAGQNYEGAIYQISQ